MYYAEIANKREKLQYGNLFTTNIIKHFWMTEVKRWSGGKLKNRKKKQK